MVDSTSFPPRSLLKPTPDKNFTREVHSNYPNMARLILAYATATLATVTLAAPLTALEEKMVVLEVPVPVSLQTCMCAVSVFSWSKGQPGVSPPVGLLRPLSSISFTDKLTNGWRDKISSVKIDDGLICHFFPYVLLLTVSRPIPRQHIIKAKSDDCDESNGYDTYHGDNPVINAGMNDEYNSYQCFLDLQPVNGNGPMVCNDGAHDGLC